MSYRAIAAALELREVSTGERLVAFSLASYANSDRQAWPNNEVAAARAGLARSRYLAARRSLAERGLIQIEHAGGTNREIAQTLFVTEKTVETHLGRAFRKLDIASRRQLPDVLAGDHP